MYPLSVGSTPLRSGTKILRHLGYGLLSTGLLLGTIAARADSDVQVVVNARTFNGYTRPKLPDGSYKPLTYAMGEGMCWDHGKKADTLEDQTFTTIIKTLSGPLRSEGFIPQTDPKQTDILIVVSWGATQGSKGENFSNATLDASRAMSDAGALPSGQNIASGGAGQAAEDEYSAAIAMQAAENNMRDDSNASNANILGYTVDYSKALYYKETGHSSLANDVVAELEANRYFVVLKAFDFKTMATTHKFKLLWEEHYSIYEKGHSLADQLLPMTRIAVQYIGQDTKGLDRKFVPDGQVKIGTPTVVGAAPTSPTTPKP